MKRWAALLAAVTALPAALLTLAALQGLDAPKGYDEITHLQNAWNVREQIGESGWAGLWQALLGHYPSEERGGYWPAFGYVLTAPFLTIIETPKAALIFSSVATGVLGALTALAGRDKALTLWVFMSAGLTVHLATTYTPVLPVAVASTLALLLLARGPERLSLRGAIALGLAIAAALLSDRLSGAFVLFLPIVWALGRAKRTGTWRAIGVALALGGSLSLPFYSGWWTRWRALLTSAHGGEGDRRALELLQWLGRDGLGPASASIVVVGLLFGVWWGFRPRRPENTDAKTSPVWGLAILGTLPLLWQTEGAQSEWFGLIWAPVAVVAGDSWQRVFKGRVVPLLATALALWSGATFALALPDDGAVDGPSFRASNAAVDSAQALSERTVVLDLLQTKTGFSALWLHYRWSVAPPKGTILWPLRRAHAEYVPSVDWLGDPCAIDRVLVFHEHTLWNAPNEMERPLSFVGMDAYQERQYRKAMTRAGACWTVERTEAIGDGRQLTVLSGAAPLGPEGSLGSTSTMGCREDMALLQGEDGPYCMDRYEYPNEENVLPLTDVTWTEAQARCVELNKRLCTEAEWEQACRGEAGTRYAYGNDFDPERCHTQANTHFDARDLMPIGSFPECQNGRGVYDLNGSASEWVSDTHQGPPYPDDNGPPERPCHIVRGGTMWDAAYGQDCNSRHWHAVGHQQSDDGFRCCADVGTR